MRTKKFRRAVCIALSILLVMTNFTYADTAKADVAKCPDIVGNKYEAQLREWVDNGFIKGAPDGNFKPDNTITRAEFMALVNRSFGFTETIEINYSDVTKDKWFYNDAAIATKAGYMQGSNGKLTPQDPISRQEFAIVLARLTNNEAAADDKIISSLSDGTSIPVWSKAAVSAALSKGYFEGLVDKSFKPAEKISRLETVVALDRAFKGMYKAVYSKKGTYGPASGMQVLEGSAVIVSPDVTLKNTTINGDLILRESIGDGNVYLDNVVVKGTTIVKGGGEHSVVIRNSSLGRVVVRREGNVVRIVATGSTTIGEVEMQSGVTLQEEFLTGEGFGDVVIPDNILAGATIVFEGAFDDIQVDSGNANINVESGTIGSLTLTQGAAGTTVNLTQQASVGTLNLNAAVNITGQGTIQTANVNAPGSTIQQQPENIVTAPGVTLVTPPQTTPAPTPTPRPTTGGGSGGGGRDDDDDSTPIYVTGVSLDKTTMTLTVGETGTIIATVSPANATNKNVTWSSSDTGVATVANGVVKAKSAGITTITVTSVANSRKTATCVVTVEEEPVIPEVNKEALITAIEAAEEKVDDADIGEEVGEYPQDAVDALLDAIEAAQDVVDDDAATQEEVDAAELALNTAVAAFEAAVITPPDTYTLYLSAIPADGGTVTKSVYDEDTGELTVTDAVYFEVGEEVTLTVTPNEGYKFIYWARDDVSEDIIDNPYTFEIPANDVSLTANFEIILVPVSAIEIDGEAKVGETLRAVDLDPEDATVDYQWQRADEEGTFEDIEGATDKTYTLTEEDAGQYIRVVVAGKDDYTGEAESDPVGPVEEEPEVDKSDLQSAIDYAYELDEEDYTEGSWTALQAALIAAEDVNDDEKATQEEVDTATRNLNNAIDALYAELKAGVEAKVAAYEALANGDLTTQALIDAANTAKAAISLEGLTEADRAVFEARIAAADVKVAAAQNVIDDKAAALNVKSEAELTEALANPVVTDIKLGGSFPLTSTVRVERAVSIDGADFTITGPEAGHGIEVLSDGVEISNLKVTGSEGYNIHIYEADGVTLANVEASDALKGGILVNYSTVSASNITTSGNAWGGIEVANGSELTVSGTNSHDEIVHIWTIDTSTVVDGSGLYKFGADIRPEKVGFTNFILASELREVPFTQAEADKAAAKAVEDLIAALPYVSEIALTDKTAVEASRVAYDALTDAQEALVTNLAKLTAAETKIAELEAAKAVALPAENITTIVPNGGDVATITAGDIDIKGNITVNTDGSTNIDGLNFSTQKPGLGGNTNYGYIGFRLDASFAGAMTLNMKNLSGTINADNAQDGDGYVLLYVPVAQKDGEGKWIPRPITNNTWTLTWKDIDGNIVGINTLHVYGTTASAPVVNNSLMTF